MTALPVFAGLIAAALSAAAAFPTAASECAKAADPANTITLQVENDLFGSGSDRHYTHGMRLSGLLAPGDTPDWFEQIVRRMPGIDECDRFAYVGALGQNIYTPEDITIPTPDPTDRPYAGWLYGSIGALAHDEETDSLYKVSLDVGIVGPLSLAGPVQREWHALIESREPRGWSAQLDNEPGFVLNYEARRHVYREQNERGLEFDVTPKAGFALGNIYTHAAAGFDVRFGQNLNLDYGPPLIRPSLPGSNLIRDRYSSNWYLFAGIEGRAVARNIFLDGNTFTDSPRVDKKRFVWDFQFGVSTIYKGWRLAYTQIIRSREFKTQHETDHFGALSVSLPL